MPIAAADGLLKTHGHKQAFQVMAGRGELEIFLPAVATIGRFVLTVELTLCLEVIHLRLCELGKDSLQTRRDFLVRHDILSHCRTSYKQIRTFLSLALINTQTKTSTVLVPIPFELRLCLISHFCTYSPNRLALDTNTMASLALVALTLSLFGAPAAAQSATVVVTTVTSPPASTATNGGFSYGPGTSEITITSSDDGSVVVSTSTDEPFSFGDPSSTTGTTAHPTGPVVTIT